MSEFQKFFNVVKDDWMKLNSFYKLSFLGAITAVILVFAIDPSITIFNRSCQFWMSLLAIALAFIVPLLSWLFTEIKIWFYRFKFPLKKIGKSYQFKGIENHNAILIIYGKNKKKARWVENPRTMYDLGFLPYYGKFTESRLTKDAIKDFKLKRGLRTRRKPGSLPEDNS